MNDTLQVWSKTQLELRQQVIEEDVDWIKEHVKHSFKDLNFVGGVDLSFFPSKTPPTANTYLQQAVAAFVILSFPDLQVVHESFQKVKLDAPYIPSYLAFREVPPLLDLIQQELPKFWNKQTTSPHPIPIMVDGNGILHPRCFGLASHLGVVGDLVTIGCAKNYYGLSWEEDEPPDTAQWKLQRKDQKELWKAISNESGKDWHTLVGSKSKRVYGAALHTGKDTSKGLLNPMFISVGHGISLETAIDLVRACSLYRVPEPVRIADLSSREYIRKFPDQVGRMN